MNNITKILLIVFVAFSFVFSAQASSLVTLNKQIGLGSKGESVVALQNFLISKGYLSGTADGKFGGKTKAGVIKYQKANKISPTGFVGPLTFASINAVITSQASSLIVTDPVELICEYARPPAGFHYENMQSHPPCGADLVPN